MSTIRLVNAEDEISLDLAGGVTDILGAQVSVSSFRLSAYSPRIDPQPRLGKAGGVATGDGFVGARQLDLGLDVTIVEASAVSYRDFAAYFLGFFRFENGPAYVYDDQDAIPFSARIPVRAQVELENEDLKTDSNTEGLVMRGVVKLVHIDGLWEDQDPVEYSSGSGGISDTDTFQITNDSSFEAYPVITLTALDANSLFRLTNIDTGLFMEIGSSDFTTGVAMEISSVTGRITIGGSDISATSLGEGSSFLSLAPGTNNFQYSSAFGSVGLELEFRRKWPR